jgi:(E)-2-((N-methylformamido)methylene)succinate hydrolase
MTARDGQFQQGKVGGTRYRVEGAGPWLVLVHGVGMDFGMWAPVAMHLAGRHRVLSYDMLGHGQSAKPPGPYGLHHFVDQLLQLTAALGIQRFDLAGFSMGALVAQGVALASPQLVGRLVLLNGVFDRSPEERAAVVDRVRDVRDGNFAESVEAALERWFTPAFYSSHPEVVQQVRDRMSGNDLAAYAAAYEVFATADAELAPRVGQIAAPTLVATGSDDRRSTAAMARALAERLPQGRLHLLEGQRHLTPIEAPKVVAELIGDFLEGVVAR